MVNRNSIFKKMNKVLKEMKEMKDEIKHSQNEIIRLQENQQINSGIVINKPPENVERTMASRITKILSEELDIILDAKTLGTLSTQDEILQNFNVLVNKMIEVIGEDHKRSKTSSTMENAYPLAEAKQRKNTSEELQEKPSTNDKVQSTKPSTSNKRRIANEKCPAELLSEDEVEIVHYKSPIKQRKEEEPNYIISATVKIDKHTELLGELLRTKNCANSGKFSKEQLTTDSMTYNLKTQTMEIGIELIQLTRDFTEDPIIVVTHAERNRLLFHLP